MGAKVSKALEAWPGGLALMAMLGGCFGTTGPDDATTLPAGDEGGSSSPFASADAQPSLSLLPSPDPKPGDPPSCAEEVPNLSSVALPRSTTDRPDDSGCPQVHVLYVVPLDGTDRKLDAQGNLSGSIASMDRWFRDQTGKTRLRFDTHQKQVDISFHRSNWTDSDLKARDPYIRDELEKELRRAGFDRPLKLYAVYYDGHSAHSCGGGAWPPTLVGTMGALYLQGAPPGSPSCASNPLAEPADPPGYLEFAMLHELFHTLGAAATCGPHEHSAGHVDDDRKDLMYAGPQAWAPAGLDVGMDDYFGHGDSECLDLARSAFLHPSPEKLEMPPAWREFQYALP